MEQDAFSRQFRKLAENRTEMEPDAIAGSDGGEIRMFSTQVDMFQNVMLSTGRDTLSDLANKAELDLVSLYPRQVLAAKDALQKIVSEAVEPDKPRMEYIIVELPAIPSHFTYELVHELEDMAVFNPFPEGTLEYDTYTDRQLEMLELRRRYAEKAEISPLQVVVVDRAIMAISYWADPRPEVNSSATFKAYLNGFNLEFKKLKYAQAVIHGVLPEEISAAINAEMDSMFPPSQEDI